jgi:hypothetical protein
MINGHSEAYLRAAINGEVARLGSAQQGERNGTLFKSAAALASLGLLEGEILHHLKPAAEFVGLRGKEFYSTAKSGVKAGHANPREAAHRTVPSEDTRSPSDLPRRSPPDRASPTTNCVAIPIAAMASPCV